MNRCYKNSEELLERALKTIPLASQTFSKSITQYPRGVSPLFLERGKGSVVKDVDGNEYIDFVNALASITLGYCDSSVDNAVISQLEKGVSFSLSTVLEAEVAEKIVDMVPCAEKVRFGKNGSDATSGAIRIARAFTGRDDVAVCGYHGWQDWYIGSTSRNLGVPEVVQKLTHKFSYNDIDSLIRIFEENSGQVGAVIMEPMNVEFPKDDFLERVKKVTHDNGALLIFDETITGFRYSEGGAQQYFGVTPDLATFGKGLANGYPLSAVTGRSDVMKLMEDVFFSGTFGGEALSLAAASAVLDKLKSEKVVSDLESKGKYLLDGLASLIESKGLNEHFSLAGHPSWSFLLIPDGKTANSFELKTLFMQEMFKKGILTLGSHNMSYSHSYEEIDTLLAAYAEVLPLIREADEGGLVLSKLACDPLKPLFKVR
ncbi:aminotransferase class III-fold pyridoxal phosphate-dependent enzyme [bacterium SCSIO 12696]|uniref:aminotransferase class III-fold pyridoxal phosphate-dependent enzyme n=1 Tax=Porticoccus sp. W117 TaxID=3054777 RepID=UPI00220A23AE|nr:aminotransferase class III-fold pyridoxal phosphate-dependent enzyme [Porticoccus sp. W117]MDM3872384.1 aminotransferase class III-fold pyridoxal phosphate-dependent enzyme [Porticoccus sp. W117]UTW46029.1 aminotransferase class III-fold pyridoxal phosphate-dependent enzyme [bacterium SCSIO 12696]